ncbi:hypothetical protein [Moorena sp. SIO4G3]|uniref:hypothetical protein n=1 Tax=Moorena sp. SIO4G3 TaxID=2607821 RepID=UPI001429EA8A|nr:hypothetical protein [Moorena sp. SIO4G3]NEO81834.1 hypothetical protein [Moorena sp. SIO4G3]
MECANSRSKLNLFVRRFSSMARIAINDIQESESFLSELKDTDVAMDQINGGLFFRPFFGPFFGPFFPRPFFPRPFFPRPFFRRRRRR